MAFCGQCGLQLPPRASNCPRCGAAIETIAPMDESHPNDPTIAMLPTLDASPASPTLPAQWPASNPPTPLPADTNPGASQMASGPTYQANTPLPPVTPQPAVNPSHPGYPGYPGYPDYSAQAGYPPVSGANYQTQGPNTAPPSYTTQPDQSSPGFMSPGGAVYQPIPDSFGARNQAPRRRGNGGLIALLVLLIVLLAGVSGFFVLKYQGILFNNGTGTGNGTGTNTGTGTGTGTQTAPTPSPTPSPSPSPVPLTQQAQTLVQNYYNDINSKDYQASYNLLGSQMQSQQPYQQYQNGFADTQQDVISFNNSTQQSDGTVRLDVTLQATHTDGTQTTYQGYYIVGPENNSLKILSGHFTQTS